MNNRWIVGARPRTLPAAVVPVMVGTAVAVHDGDAIWWRAAFALVVSLALQIGVNYANDYSDGIRGTDEVRVGPPRLVGSKLAAPPAVKRAAFLSFGVAMMAGTVLAVVASPWLLLVGAVSVLAGWYYTGGKHPYGYSGLGEAAVFVFFGLVAVVGTTYVQLERFTDLAFGAAIPVGLLAVALLVINNLRDIPGDTDAGKRTLAVRLGDKRTRKLYTGLIMGAALLCAGLINFPNDIGYGAAAIVLVLLAVPPVRKVEQGVKGRDLVPVLQGTGRLQLLYGTFLSIGLIAL